MTLAVKVGDTVVVRGRVTKLSVLDKVRKIVYLNTDNNHSVCVYLNDISEVLEAPWVPKTGDRYIKDGITLPCVCLSVTPKWIVIQIEGRGDYEPMVFKNDDTFTKIRKPLTDCHFDVIISLRR